MFRLRLHLFQNPVGKKPSSIEFIFPLVSKKVTLIKLCRVKYRTVLEVKRVPGKTCLWHAVHNGTWADLLKHS